MGDLSVSFFCFLSVHGCYIPPYIMKSLPLTSSLSTCAHACMGFSLEPCALSLIWNMQLTLSIAHCSWSCQVRISCVIVCWRITEWWQPGSPRDQVHAKLSSTLLVWCRISVHSVVQY